MLCEQNIIYISVIEFLYLNLDLKCILLEI